MDDQENLKLEKDTLIGKIGSLTDQIKEIMDLNENLKQDNGRLRETNDNDRSVFLKDKESLERKILELRDQIVKEKEGRNMEYERLQDEKEKMDAENEEIIGRLNSLVAEKEKIIEMEIGK